MGAVGTAVNLLGPAGAHWSCTVLAKAGVHVVGDCRAGMKVLGQSVNARLSRNSNLLRWVPFQSRQLCPRLRRRTPCTVCGCQSKHSHFATTGGGGSFGNRGGRGGGGGGGGGGFDGAPVIASAASLSSNAHSVREDVVLLDVGGMMCGGCVGRVKRLLEGHDSVTVASVNLATETALVRVTLSDPTFDIEVGKDGHLMALGTTLAQILTDAGFKSAVRDPNGSTAAHAAVMQRKRAEREERLRDATARLALAWLLASTCLVGHLAHCWPGIVTAPAWLQFLASTNLHALLSAATLLGPGRAIFVEGFKAIQKGAPDMNTLVALGAGSAFGVSVTAALLPQLGWRTFFEEPAMLLGVVLLGRTLEERAKLQASADMVALQGLLPSSARLVMQDGISFREVPADAVIAGDVIRVLPGDRIPVDGTVVSGRTTVDESALTGEPMPITKTAESAVTAGTINLDGVINVRSEASGSDTAIADIVRMVETAQARTAPVQRLADEVAGKFAYTVMGVSAATFLFWSTVGQKLFPAVLAMSATASPLLLSLQLACNVLVVACPCALGLATPTAVLVGTSAGAKRGLLIRGGDILEALSKVDTVVFDKTGTLTEGQPAVTQIRALEGQPEHLLALAAAVEMGSTHPIGRALVRAQAATAAAPLVAEEGSLEQEPGSGIVGSVAGSRVVVGTPDWLTRQGCSVSSSRVYEGDDTQGLTRVFVGVNGRLAGWIDLLDTARSGARETIEELHRLGLRTILLTGDQPGAARAIGASLGIGPNDIFAAVKPAGKQAKIRELQESGAVVAMVGDGVNDTAALAQAEVGIAMGGGVQAASDVAEVLLLGNKPEQVVDAISLSQATLTKIRQNLIWAFGYNLVGIPLAAGALLPHFGIALTPSISGALMGISSLGVMGNSLLLQLEARKPGLLIKHEEVQKVPDVAPADPVSATTG